MEGPNRPQSRVPHDLLALAVMVVMTCVSIAWGMATLNCPTGKDRWGACIPPAKDAALRKETREFTQLLLVRR
jgi:hypothetical protein